MKKVNLQSTVGIGDRSSWSNSYFEGEEGRPDLIEFDNAAYLVGEGVHDHTRRVIGRTDFSRLGDGPQARAMTYATLGRLLSPGDHRVNVVAGYPVQIMRTGDPDGISDQLRGWLVGEHRFRLNSRSYCVRVEDMELLTQPEGAWFAFHFDEHGKMARQPEQGVTAIGDLGFNTLDLLAVKIAGKRRSLYKPFSGGTARGMHTAAQTLRAELRRIAGVDVPLAECDALIRAGAAGPRMYGGQRVALPALIAQARGVLVSEVLVYMREVWGELPNFAWLVFVGGGAEALRGELTAAYPTGQVLRDPVHANAIGLAIYGLMKFQSSVPVIGLDPGFGGFKGVILER